MIAAAKMSPFFWLEEDFRFKLRIVNVSLWETFDA